MSGRMRQRLLLTLRALRQVLATALGGLLALLVVVLFLLLMLVELPIALLAITFMALAAASMLWPNAVTDWLAAVQAFG